jgi:hypothetical protein
MLCLVGGAAYLVRIAMRQLPLDPVFPVSLIVERGAHRMAKSVRRLFPMVADPLEHSGDGPVAQGLPGTLRPTNTWSKLPVVFCNSRSMATAWPGQRCQMEIATLHAFAALVDCPKCGVEVRRVRVKPGQFAVPKLGGRRLRLFWSGKLIGPARRNHPRLAAKAITRNRQYFDPSDITRSVSPCPAAIADSPRRSSRS